MPCAERVGPTTAPSGPAPVLANLSARQAKEMGLLTSGTSGPPSSGSSRSVALATSVANRLRQAMRFDGGILWRLTWKARHTPSARWIYQRQASARRTSGADCSGWPTPQLSDTTGGGQAKRATNPERSNDLNDYALLVSPWPTPNTLDTIDREGLRPSRIANITTLATTSAWTAGVRGPGPNDTDWA